MSPFSSWSVTCARSPEQSESDVLPAGKSFQDRTGARGTTLAESWIFGFFDFSKNVDIRKFPMGFGGVWEGLQSIENGSGPEGRSGGSGTLHR